MKWAGRATAIVMATAAVAITAAPSASAGAAGQRSCGSYDYTNRMYLWACHYAAQQGDGTLHRADAVVASAGMDPAKWDLCEVRIGLDVQPPGGSYSRRATRYHSGMNGCTQTFRWLSANPGNAWAFYGPEFTPSAGYCYRPITRWLGIYNGVAYDSGGVFGPVYCGTRSTPGVTGDGVIDPGVGDLPGIAVAPELI